MQKLDGLEARFEEVSTLITDPNVISDQKRFVKLTKEYKDLGDLMDVRKRYIACLNAISEAKDILANESDPEMKEMAREELATNEDLQPKLEEEIKIALVPKDPEDAKNVQMGPDPNCTLGDILVRIHLAQDVGTHSGIPLYELAERCLVGEVHFIGYLLNACLGCQKHGSGG